MSRKCWVCLGSMKHVGGRGVCLTCYNRNYRRFGPQWYEIARAAVDAGNRHLLGSKSRAERGVVAELRKTPVKAPPAPVQRVYDDSAVPTGPAGVALLKARKNPERMVIAVPLGPDHTRADILYFTPYLDAKSRIQVRPVTE